MTSFLQILALMLVAMCATPMVSQANNSPEKLSSSALFKQVSPSVVLLVGNNSLGSGAVINRTDILTNWHVIAQSSRILVAFKPLTEGVTISPDELVVGDVIKTEPGKDLAIVRVKRIPQHIEPIKLGALSEVEIGADVHAIGHPQGESWTYTKGVISQIRKNFTWQTDGTAKFKADVIQTQTPINPGNSGGPLLSDKGRLVGLNSFKAKGAEGLNFAVALSEISRFLGVPPANDAISPAPESTPPSSDKGRAKAETEKTPPTPKTVAELLYQGRDKDGSGYVRVYSVPGKQKGETIFFFPDTQSLPAFCFELTDDVADAVIMDMQRNGKWDYSVHDMDRNGKFETVGLHPDGAIKPSSFLPLKDKKVPAIVKASLPKRIPEQGDRPAGSPSFDCTRADTLVKQTICGDDALADLDVTVTALYSRVVQKRPALRQQIAAGQKEWQSGTENMCQQGDVTSCLTDRYKQRIIYLNVLMVQQ